MKGKVEEISRETSKRGDEYLRVQIDGEMYSIWDQDHFDAFSEGDTIDFEYKESGQWKNITDLTVAGAGSETPPGREEYLRLRDQRIAKMSCVKSAAYVMANLDLDPQEKGEQTLSLARTFEKYVYDEDISTES
ncbi:MAG: hypothetical protein ABII79_05505 [bacterium]